MKVCIGCQKKRKIHGKNLCKSCYNKPYTKKWIKIHSARWRNICRRAMRKMRARRHFNLTREEYEKLISGGCVICGFNIIVQCLKGPSSLIWFVNSVITSAKRFPSEALTHSSRTRLGSIPNCLINILCNRSNLS